MEEQRIDERFSMRIPVRTESSDGELIDMSRSGISYRTTESHMVGEPIDIHFQLRSRASSLDLHCRGEVVRVEPLADGWLVAGSIEWLDV